MKIFGRDLRQFRILSGWMFSPQIRVPTERHGSSYGGWVICPEAVNADSVVCSFGVGEDATFDLSLIAKYNLTVYAFDPTPRSVSWLQSQQLPPAFIFFSWGLAGYDGLAEFYPPKNPEHVSHSIIARPQADQQAVTLPVYRLESIVDRLKLTRIDILKMDIEGAEYAVIEDLSRTTVDIRQLLVEFHHRFETIGWQKTRSAVRRLNDLGYKIFYVSDTGEEYSFIHA